MSWIQTFSGKVFDIDNLTTEAISLRDIAHALAGVCRYNAHTKFHYSVSEHSIIMSYNVSKEAEIYALMHDSAEAYLPDMPRPFKHLVKGFSELEHKIRNVIDEKFRIPTPSKEIMEEIKLADLRMLVTEKAQVLLDNCTMKWESTEGIKPFVTKPNKAAGEIPVIYPIKGLSRVDAEKAFLERFYELI